jgi:trigger factor
MSDDATAVADPQAEETGSPDRPEQDVKVEDIGPGMKRLTITLPESRIKAKIEDLYAGLKNDAVLPGFRKGRAPRRLIEKRFAEGVKSDLKGQLLSESYTQATEDHELDVLGEPDVKDVEELEVPESGDLTYTVEIEVSPKVDLPDFSEIKVEKKTYEVTDEDVEKEIEQYRERYGKMDTVEDATVGEGDYVQSDVHIFAGHDVADDIDPHAGGDDESAEGLLHHQHGAYTLVHGEDKDHKGHVAGILVQDLGQKLTGKKIGDRVRIEMTGPDAHENDEIKAKPITILMDVTHVHRLEPADMETLLPQLGVQDEAELKEQLKTMIERRQEQEQAADMHRQVTEQLVEKVDLELPEGLKGRQIDRQLQRQRMELMYAGKSEEEIETELAESRDKGEQEAIKQLKQFFVIDQAAKDLEVEVSENEINGRIAMMAYQQGRRPEKMRAEMRQRGELEQIYLSMREHKTLDKIIEKATVTEVDGDKK